MLLGIDLHDAAPADLGMVFAFHEALFREEIEALLGWDHEAQLSNLAAEWETTRIRLIRMAGEVAGYLQQRSEADHIYLLSLGLLPGQQGRGAGRATMEILQAEALELGLPLRLSVSRENLRAIRFYERLGFLPTIPGTERQYRLEWCPRA
ncbi:GNAT family N-acetyltransferase [Haloferula sp. BvORR071]|uniref:GNAT family N-acetyltransferase n=1 Tax=Haloferula sp. BvORR071 TaxID=1396141 RepID=UPI000697BE45|nr:GNAT family N-acetyltransferase [Haloferula sp. BvORR071]